MTIPELATVKADELLKELEPLIRLNELEKDAIKCQLGIAFMDGAAFGIESVNNIIKS